MKIIFSVENMILAGQRILVLETEPHQNYAAPQHCSYNSVQVSISVTLISVFLELAKQNTKGRFVFKTGKC
jgi:hypothetical protein